MTRVRALRGWVRGSVAAVACAMGRGVTARVARAVEHGLAIARVTRAGCRFVLFMAVGALWCAMAGAQQVQPTQPGQPSPARQVPQTQQAPQSQQVPQTQQVPQSQQVPQTQQVPQSQQAQNAPVAAPSRPFGAPSVTTSAAPSGIASLGQVTLALGLVLALIFVAAWLMRRLRGFGRTGTGALDILADLPVGQKERAVLIRVGTQQVLIGVAPGRVTTLHVLDEPVSVTPPGGSATDSSAPSAASAPSMERPTFKSLLLKSLGK